MSVNKFRWSKVYESSEEELVLLLRARNIQSVRVDAEAFGEQTHQAPGQITTLWCVEGSLVLRSGSITLSLQAGDAVRINPATAYDLHAGIFGYACYEST